MNSTQRQITAREIQKAQEIYQILAKPYIDKLIDVHNGLIPKIIVTETGIQVYYEESEAIVEIRKRLDELSREIKYDLESGKFF